MTITPQEPLDSFAIGCAIHEWAVEGGSIRVSTDEALGLQIKRIVVAVAAVAAIFYVAGHTLGSAIHQLNASLTRLSAALPTTAPALHAHTHPALPAAHGDDRPRARRPRQPQPQPVPSGAGFA